MKTTAILLKKIKYGEKNLILQTYTREEGSMAFFIGASLLHGKSKSSLPALGVLEIISSKGKGDLKRIKEIELRQKNYDLISNMHKSSLVMFINEVLLKTIGDYNRDDALFDFITTSLNILDQQRENDVNFHLKFMLELSKYLGFYPNGQYTVSNPYFDLFEGLFSAHQPVHQAVMNPELAKIFSQFLHSSFSDLKEIKMSNKERRTLLSAIIDYYKIHVEKFEDLKSKEILETILS